MRRAAARRAATRNLRDRIRVRQVFPLWGRNRAPRQGRITAKQPSREIIRSDEVGKWIVLTIACHINYIRGVPIDRNRKMNGSLSARVESDIASRPRSLR